MVKHYLALFTPYTWVGFQHHGGDVVGFPTSIIPRTKKLEVGDVLVAYLSGISRWCGVFKISGPMYRDSTPIFCVGKDRYNLRFPVKSQVVLDPEYAIPMDAVWEELNRTKDVVRASVGWATKAGMLSSLGSIDEHDGALLTTRLVRQASEKHVYELSEDQQMRLRRESAKRDADIAESTRNFRDR